MAEAKKAALKKLEDVLLEPPRSASGKSKTYLKRTKYLPDLMGVSLWSYPRRVFIDVGLPEKSDATSDWFSKNYPTRNEDFEIYKIEIGTTGESAVGMSDWLRKNVREEEYVVMKAEAEVVEEMVRNERRNSVSRLLKELTPSLISRYTRSCSKYKENDFSNGPSRWGEIRARETPNSAASFTRITGTRP